VKEFPDGFLWGVSTSSYQVEGAVDVDGRGPSIWDTFSHEPGRIDGGGTGDVACDHYRRWRSDLDLIASLGVNAYRFSIAWPRLYPTGEGALERRGLDHYNRLIDGLVERGIEPVVTLYHWDLPQALEDRGGWLSRDVVERFAEYAATCFDAYGDRVRWWITINEPWIIGLLGYRLGLHAPGRRDLRSSVEAMHNVLLAHGRAVQDLRTRRSGACIGVAFALAPHHPDRDDDADREVTWGSDGYVNRWFLDPVLKGFYPEDMRRRYESLVGPLDFVREGDLATINAGSDFIGVNYYSRRVMRAEPKEEPFGWKVVVPEGVELTDAGTEITPDAFTELLVRLRDDYLELPLLICENGAVYGDEPGPDGRVRDRRRIRFLHDHLAAVHDAIEQGAPVVGYCHWSFMDNFEWALGYAQRFGLVHVDYDTLERTVKDSGRYYSDVVRANALVTPEVVA
jgi:beta-glucosidase